MMTHPWAVLLVCRCPELGEAMDCPSPDSESPLPASYAPWRHLTRLEAGAFASLGVGVDHAR